MNKNNWSPYTVTNTKSWVKNYIEPFLRI
ncbi:hypothetical protein LWF04_15450 [Clostridioides difficile]|nr:hypothetical protein [Clostridioides difficile]MCD8613042.1 hypothetical protein [Clostridioides difficile]MCD8657401.1 hypothetical protein [Clostridioides difficile]MCD8682593.1 hypothetical protein [Clostridioides difficile]MCD8695105.1 hypothetical protein [Clostridioides difficile]MCE0574715.1 hypothetical protein [Clostridioides difficile]